MSSARAGLATTTQLAELMQAGRTAANTLLGFMRLAVERRVLRSVEPEKRSSIATLQSAAAAKQAEAAAATGGGGDDEDMMDASSR